MLTYSSELIEAVSKGYSKSQKQAGYSVEHVIGNDGVSSSILLGGTIKSMS